MHLRRHDSRACAANKQIERIQSNNTCLEKSFWSVSACHTPGEPLSGLAVASSPKLMLMLQMCELAPPRGRSGSRRAAQRRARVGRRGWSSLLGVFWNSWLRTWTARSAYFCSSRERAKAACSSARESGCCEALVLRRAAEAESAILSSAATEAAVPSRQRAGTRKHWIARCAARVRIVSNLWCVHWMCGCCTRDMAK